MELVVWYFDKEVQGYSSQNYSWCEILLKKINVSQQKID